MAYKAPKVITDRKIRFAVVGCGRISDRHTGALAKHDADAELTAICDTNETLLAQQSSNISSQRAERTIDEGSFLAALNRVLTTVIMS